MKSMWHSPVTEIISEEKKSSHAIFGLLADNTKRPINTDFYICMWYEHLSSETWRPIAHFGSGHLTAAFSSERCRWDHSQVLGKTGPQAAKALLFCCHWEKNQNQPTKKKKPEKSKQKKETPFKLLLSCSGKSKTIQSFWPHFASFSLWMTAA